MTEAGNSQAGDPTGLQTGLNEALGAGALTANSGYVNTLPVQTPGTKFYTEDDLNRVRSQEKDKLYTSIEELKTKVSAYEKEREEQLARQQAKEAEEIAVREAAEKARLLEESTAKDYAKETAEELRQQLARERQEREAAFALLDQERKFTELQTYRQQLIEQNRDSIIPQLINSIQGNTPEELNQSVAYWTEQSNSILGDVQATAQAQRQAMPGTRATNPGFGPLETNLESRQFTAAEIAAMPMNEYAKIRPQILSQRAQGKTSGILG